MSRCGNCGICACGGCCLAGNGDDDFVLASKKKIIDNLDKGKYPSQRKLMIDTLKQVYDFEYKSDKEDGE